MLLDDALAPGLIAGHDPCAERQDTWRPDPGTDLRDGRGLHELLYEAGDARAPRGWCAEPTEWLVERAIDVIEEHIERLGPGGTIRVLDYGTGTGLAAIELLKRCRERGVGERLDERGASMELHLVDIPSSWFAQGYALLRDCAWTRFHALTDPGRRFRPLPDVVGAGTMDLVIASMVFHLIPPRALERAADGLAAVMRPGGRLLWNSPDLGPASADAVLFHDPNRALRERWRELVGARAQTSSRLLGVAVEAARRRLREDAALMNDQRADRRILRRAHTGADVAGALGGRMSGAIVTGSYEMTTEESLDALLVPSNQEEYLPEIDDPAMRADVVEELLRDEVLPELHRTPAATAGGLNIRWTFGDYATS